MDDDELFDTVIVSLLQAYRAVAIPRDEIARARALEEASALRRLEQRLISLAEEGHVRRSRVFPDRWLATAGRQGTSAETARTRPSGDVDCMRDQSATPPSK
jgi:hypothetical protein